MAHKALLIVALFAAAVAACGPAPAGGTRTSIAASGSSSSASPAKKLEQIKAARDACERAESSCLTGAILAPTKKERDAKKSTCEAEYHTCALAAQSQ